MHAETFTEADFDSVLTRELNSRTKLTDPPSTQMQAWRDYDYQQFELLGRHPRPSARAYNLYTDTCGMLHLAYDVLTDDNCRRLTGFTRKSIARRALAMLSRAFGFRYLRGLKAIEPKLKGAELEQYRRGRLEFRHAFEQAADEAHRANDKSQNPGMVLVVVRLFERELLALCPWLARVGVEAEAELLRKKATLPPERRAFI